jgi:hypothetical protein
MTPNPALDHFLRVLSKPWRLFNVVSQAIYDTYLAGGSVYACGRNIDHLYNCCYSNDTYDTYLRYYVLFGIITCP